MTSSTFPSPLIHRALPVSPVTGRESYDFARKKDRTCFRFPCESGETKTAKDDSQNETSSQNATDDSQPKRNERVLVWFPGSGQCADNEMLRRLLNSWVGIVKLDTVLAVPYEDATSTIQSLLKTRKSSPTVFVGGHSRGAGVAARVAKEYQLNSILCGTSPPPLSTRASYRCLTVIGENDGGKLYLPSSFAWPTTSSCYETETGNSVWVSHLEGRACNVVAVAREGDHSLRSRPSRRSSDADKERCSTTEETKSMNRDVAVLVSDFVRSCAPA